MKQRNEGQNTEDRDRIWWKEEGCPGEKHTGASKDWWCFHSLSFHSALLFTRVSGRSKQRCNLETEAESQHTDAGPWWGLRGTGHWTSAGPQVPDVPKASREVRGNPTNCSVLRGDTAQKDRAKVRGQRPFRAAAPFPTVASGEGEKVGQAEGNVYAGTAKKPRLPSPPH